MKLAVVGPTNRDGELIADSVSECTRLHKREVMRIRRRPAAYKARLPGHELPVLLIAQTNRLAQGALRDCEAACAGRVADSDQDAAIAGQGGLHDRHTGPIVLPQNLAIGRRDAQGAFAAQQHHLRDATGRKQMRRTVASARRLGLPSCLACGEVVGDHAA